MGKNIFKLGIVFASLFFFFCYAQAYVNVTTKLYTTHSPVISIVSADIDGNGQTEMITGTVDNTILVLNTKGEVVWKYNVQGIPLAISVGDINADGKKEIAVAAQDSEGHLYILNYKGSLVWSYKSDFDFLSVDMGDITADRFDEIVVGDVLGYIHVISSEGKLKWKKQFANSSISSLKIGDINNDKKSEIVLGTQTDGIILINSEGGLIWKKGSMMKGLGKAQSSEARSIGSIAIGDVDLDGTNEVIVGSRPNSMVSVFSGKGKLLWQKRFTKVTNNWSTSVVGIGDLVGDNKKEIVVLLHGIVWKEDNPTKLMYVDNATSPLFLLDSKGTVIWDYRPQVNFYSFFVNNMVKNGKAEILTTSPTRGHYFYSLSIHESNQRTTNNIMERPTDNIDNLRKKLAEVPGQKYMQEGTSVFHVLYSSSITNPDLEQINKFFTSMKTENLSFEFLITGIYEKAVVSKGFSSRYMAAKSSYNSDEILKLMETFEKKQIPFFLLVGERCRLHVSLQTIKKILSIAPKYCRGFIVHENSYSHASRWNKFISDIESLLVLCKHENKKLILNEHQDFWLRATLFDAASKKLFKPEFKNVLIPMYKTNRYMMPELNIGSILGLWKAGKFKEWGFSTQDDAWRWESLFIVPPHDVLLRMEILAASLGATYFRIEQGKELLEKKHGVISFSEGAQRHRGLFYNLIRKNIIRPVYDNTQIMISPVVFVHTPSIEWKRPQEPEDYFRYLYTSAKINRLFGTQFLFQKTNDVYLSRLIYGLNSYIDGILPETPYGYVGIIPYWVDISSLDGVKKYWMIDGRSIFQGKQRLDVIQAKKQIEESFKETAKNLPFRANGVFLSAQKFQNEYLVYLIAPGCLDISDVNTELHISDSIKFYGVTDAISGKEIPIKNRKVDLRIPGGTFRILKVALVSDSKVTNKTISKDTF